MTSTSTDGPAGPPDAGLAHGLRFAFGTLTVLPARITRWDRAAARSGMLCAPAAGLVVGLGAAVVGAGFAGGGAGPLLAAVAALAVPAVLTRGLHLDGLADTADGLGSGRPAEDALGIMKRSDIGPFGVVALLFVLLGQVAALAGLYGRGWLWGVLGTVAASVTARVALTLAARRGVPAARPEGLGAVVASVVPVGGALVVAGAVLAGCAAVGAVFGPYGVLRFASAVVLALLAAEALLRHCVRRFGGVTGDVFGALAETACTVTLVVLAFGG